LNNEKIDVTLQLSDIKSVQLEFVKHSLLSRKKIKLEKEIENLQLEQAPKVRRVKRFGRIVKVNSFSKQKNSRSLY
jgi:hypothetical protein